MTKNTIEAWDALTRAQYEWEKTEKTLKEVQEEKKAAKHYAKKVTKKAIDITRKGREDTNDYWLRADANAYWLIAQDAWAFVQAISKEVKYRKTISKEAWKVVLIADKAWGAELHKILNRID